MISATYRASCSHPAPNRPDKDWRAGLGKNWAIVAGNRINEEAKIGGMTPAELIFRGRCVLWPPYIFLPTTRFAYWIGIRPSGRPKKKKKNKTEEKKKNTN